MTKESQNGCSMKQRPPRGYERGFWPDPTGKKTKPIEVLESVFPPEWTFGFDWVGPVMEQHPVLVVRDATGNELRASIIEKEYSYKIWLGYISIEERGKGMGTAFMESLRKYADIRDKVIDSNPCG